MACEPDHGQSRVVLTLDATYVDWVTDLEWTDSNGVSTGNIAARNGPSNCNGTAPTENFGQAYMAPEGNAPYPGGAGYLGTVTTCGLTRTSVHGPVDCAGNPASPLTTVLQLFGGARDNQVKITRTFSFDQSTPVYGGVGMRPYVPRLPLSTFYDVIVPNGASTSTSVTNAGSCGGDCITPTGSSWNGRWIADLAPATGVAMIILRDASMTSAVDFTINNDAASASNLSSFVLVQPSDGWKVPVTEIERLCFEDLTTWPQAERDAAVLPSNCSD